MTLAADLWSDNADLAHAALNHPFVRALATGTLPRPLFQAFILQDAFFLEAFARAYALALARCPDPDGRRDFFSLLAGVMDELNLHESYVTTWGVSVSGLTPAKTTLAYTDFLLATAALHSVGETCAAMTPCMRLYAFLGQTLAGSSPSDNPYGQWLTTYAAAEFEALAARLETLLDRYAAASAGVRDAYRRAMSLELDFFEAACR